MSERNFSLSDFDYQLPESLIAQKPAYPRDHSRLLVYRRSDRSITDDYFYNIADYLPDHSTLVLNNSRVEKARLLFGNKEVFITRVIDPYTVEALIRPGKRFKTGNTVTLTDRKTSTKHQSRVDRNVQADDGTRTDHDTHSDHQNLTDYDARVDRNSRSGTSVDENNSPVSIKAEVLNTASDGLRMLRFNYPVNHPVFDPFRHTPFPPYIKPDEKYSERYQTIYARDEGSKAAPTAGLHFTDRVFSELSRKTIRNIELTLHVGLGTFAPVKTESILSHKMHSEWYKITPEAAEALRSARFITAVGTTTARVLESAAGKSGRDDASPIPNPNTNPTSNLISTTFPDFQAQERETDIFITPGYQFQAIDALLTNFHLPKSTLLMMVSAFIGIDEMHRIYKHAIDRKYRFYSFGDAMLLL